MAARPLGGADALADALGPDGAAALQRLAVAAVRAAVLDEPLPAEARAGVPDVPVFGAFVTIHRRGGDLRGCIGSLGDVRSAADLVVRSARSSALEDPRFPVVRPAELPGLAVEVSLLAPLEELDPAVLPEGVEVGKHGLVVEREHRRGLLLPQVAADRAWTPELFLDETCRKAGLPRGDWRRGARVFRFAALVVGEDGRVRDLAR